MNGIIIIAIMVVIGLWASSITTKLCFKIASASLSILEQYIITTILSTIVVILLEIIAQCSTYLAPSAHINERVILFWSLISGILLALVAQTTKLYME